MSRVNRSRKGAKPAAAILAIFLCGFVLINLGQLTASASSRTPLAGDCRNTPNRVGYLLFVVHNSNGVPISDVTITVNGISKATNSSGIVTFYYAGTPSFEVRFNGMNFFGSIQGQPVQSVCLGNSYYQLISLVTEAPHLGSPSVVNA
jgi:hypothetical protein